MAKSASNTTGKTVAHKGRQVLVDKKLRIDWIRSKVAVLDDEHLKLVEGVIRRFLKE
ncbi:MAG: hypothetical protein ACW96N_05865 [Candidatus Thorarchaeota archaeon]|jgi:hypothetical protein